MESKGSGIINRVQKVTSKYNLLPYSEEYRQSVDAYLSQIDPSIHNTVNISNMFLYPYLLYTIFDNDLYFTSRFYGRIPVLISKPDDLFHSYNLPIPEPPLKECLYQGLKECLKNWLKPWSPSKRKIISDCTSESRLDQTLRSTSEIKKSLTKIYKVITALKDYYLHNGLPCLLLNTFYYLPLDPFNRNLYQIDNNIIAVVPVCDMKSLPNPSKIHVFTVTEWLACFNSKGLEYDRDTIRAAYPILRSALKSYPENDKHSYIIFNDNNYFEVMFQSKQPRLSKFLPKNDRLLYFAAQNLHYNQQSPEAVQSLMAYLLQHKFSNLKFFSSLLNALYTSPLKHSLYIIRMSKDNDYNEQFMCLLQQLLPLQDISNIIQNNEFSPANLSDWYSHLYCAIFHMNAKIARKEDSLLKWIKGSMISSKHHHENIFYRNTMPLIMLIDTNEDISYLRTFFNHRKIQLYDLELSCCSDEMPVVQTSQRDILRFLLLLGNIYKAGKIKKETKASESLSQEDILKDFIERFCSIDSEKATPILSKEFYKNYIEPYYIRRQVTSIGPTRFNKYLPKLFPEQIECKKFHAKAKVEGIHIFNMVFHEETWNTFWKEEEPTAVIEEQDTFSDSLQQYLDFSSKIIDSIYDNLPSAECSRHHN